MFNETCPSFDDIFEEYYAAGQRLKEFVTDTSKILDDAFVADEKVLFEGAQGVMLDIDHGTYPFVTSSNPIAGNVTVGTGVGPTFVSKVIGVCKAYHVLVMVHSLLNYSMKMDIILEAWLVKTAQKQQDVHVV